MKSNIFFLLFLLLLSCKTEEKSAQEITKEVNSDVTIVKQEQEKHEHNIEPKMSSNDVNNRSRNSKLLQGLWENIEDSNKRVEFKNSKMINIITQVQADEGSTFAITDKCEQSNINIQGESKGRFITVPSMNQCYYIALLNGKNLHLGDLSNGKTLRYKKVLPN